MRRYIKLKTTFSVLLLFIFICGCTREKAEALKNTAEQFKIQSIMALEKIKWLFSQSISTPAEDNKRKIEKMVADLDSVTAIDASKLDLLINETAVTEGALNAINEEFDNLERKHIQFADMFRALPEGSFFAKDAVKKAEKHAMSLTLEFINFASFLERYPVQFAGRRVAIIEDIRKIKAITDDELRQRNLEISAKSILKLRNDEAQAKAAAILECLKAAEAGKLVTELIRDYDSLSIGDLLVLSRNTLIFIAEISAGNKEIETLLKRYTVLEQTIRDDPYWKSILDLKTNP